MPLRETVDRFWPTLVALVGAVAIVVGVFALFGGRVESAQGPLPDDAVATTSPLPTASPDGSTTGPTTEPPAAARPPVAILNGADVAGLAGATQLRLQDGGWDVVEIGDYRGEASETTVYYPPGLEAAARELSAQFPEVGVVEPIDSDLPEDRLTVVLGPDYPQEYDG